MRDEMAITVKNLYKQFNKETVLTNINLELEKGHIYGLVGRNGSGKSILFKCIVGLLNATSGQIIVNNKTIGKGQLPEGMGVLLDKPGFLLHYTGFQNLKLLASINDKITDEEIKEAISIVGLNPASKQIVRKYSLGMKQRLGLAQAIMEKPDIIILDEPMNGLDEDGVEDIRELLLDLKRKGKTIFLSSHNSEDINRLCDTVFLIKNGQLVKNV